MQKVKKVYKFPEIGQLRHVVRNVQHYTRYTGEDKDGEPIYDESISLPKLKFRGSVKIHGTNGSVVYFRKTEVMQTQSRENVITPEQDNMGFARFVSETDFTHLLHVLTSRMKNDSVVCIYGEWAGEGIQKGMAVSELKKMFIIFAVKIDDEWLDDDVLRNVKDPDKRIYNILDYQTYEIEIDFDNLESKEAQNKLQKLIEEVENECPVGKAFGISGIGEGIVWMPVDPEWNSSRYWYKTKGKKHESTKRKEKIPVDVEKMKNVEEFVVSVLTESRLEQGLDHLRENRLDLDRKNLGTYLKWINGDVMKEESDTLEASGLVVKDVNSTISKKARDWFFKKEDEALEL